MNFVSKGNIGNHGTVTNISMGGNVVFGNITTGGDVHIGDKQRKKKGGPKILVVGDLHFHEGDLILPKLFTSKLAKILGSSSYSCCVLLGDVFHKFKTVDQPALASVTELFHMITECCPLFVLVGNHDYINGSQFLTKHHTLLPFDYWPNVRVIDTPTIVKMSNCRLLFVPYVPKGQFLEALEHAGDWNSVDMIFAHQEFQGCQMGGHVSVDGDCWSPKFPPIISGHAHIKHKVGNNIIYPGTPYDLGYGELGNRCVAELVFSDDTYTINYINTNLPRKKIVRLNVDDVKEWFPEGNDFYKLKVLGSAEEYSSFTGSSHAKDLRIAGVKIVHVKPDTKRIEEYLEKKKAESKGCESYRDIFTALVEKEGLKDLGDKILN